MYESSSAPRSTMREAIDLIDAGACVWCESAPAAAESYLCRGCSQSDPGGVLAKPQHRVLAAEGRDSASN
jgi:hypothetical protein